MVEIFLLQILIDLDELILAVQSVVKVLHSFDFSLAVDELAAPRVVHPYKAVFLDTFEGSLLHALK